MYSTRYIVLVGVTIFVLAGCEDEPSAAAPSAKTSASASMSSTAPAPDVKLGECTSASLKKELLGYCDAGLASGPPGMVELPWSVPPGKRPPEAIEIFMTRNDQINIEGGITSVTAFANVWRRRAELRKLTQPGGGTPWLLAVGPQVDVAQVAKVLDSLLARGDRRGHLVFAAKDSRDLGIGPRDRAKLAALHDEIDSADLSQKAMGLARAIQKSKMMTCRPLMQVFAALATAPPSQKCRLLAEGAAEKFPSCQCKHADEVLTMLYAVMADTEPPTRRGAWVPVTLADDAEAVAVRAGTPWATFVSQLAQARLGALHVVVN